MILHVRGHDTETLLMLAEVSQGSETYFQFNNFH
jgi:hypothetical protein